MDAHSGGTRQHVRVRSWRPTDLVTQNTMPALTVLTLQSHIPSGLACNQLRGFSKDHLLTSSLPSQDPIADPRTVLAKKTEYSHSFIHSFSLCQAFWALEIQSDRQIKIPLMPILMEEMATK